MVSFNMLLKLYVVVAFGYSATVSSTDVAQEQPKEESLYSKFSRNDDEQASELPEAEKPPKYSVEWYLLPKPMNRACLRRKLPWELRNGVPKDCNEPISPKIEKRIRSFFSSSPLNQSLRQTFSYHCST